MKKAVKMFLSLSLAASMTLQTMPVLATEMQVQEGIETEEQYNTILKIGCDMIQGFYFYHPMDEKSLIDVMIRQNHSSDQ